ncbi:hypothetical protein M378DRAFT_165974 [Amanita muscaria Koide BX008]|uniref:Oxidized purine nucleoside triphosphate hydrolase n=1 Tax=Amanita muscaria (strain Koide BX008) TaxID=946122 RepID=A0A0C2WL36_AMAMK|nr:hypothetical protein M378DRAFT_165974 [Amanita muscaria Koide BX008]
MSPPGLRPALKLYSASNDDAEWLPYEKKKKYTNAFIFQNTRILLGYKKRGFGKDLYNGFGGKVEASETPLQAAKRELEEEAGIQAPLKHAGELLFILEGDPVAFHIDVFRADSYSGVITETEEMRPKWFRVEDSPVGEGNECPPIPFSEMWEDDVYWFPLLFQGRHFAGRADFIHNGEKFVLRRWWFGTDDEE